MSQTIIKHTFTVGGVPTDPTSIKLSDPTSTYGVRRTDNDAVVVNDGTAMTKLDTGVYQHVFTDPASDLTYEYYVEITYGGETHHVYDTTEGGVTASNTLYDLLPQIKPWVRGAPEPVLKQALRDIAREFCLQTEIWQEDLTAIASVADQEDYTLTTAHTAEFLRVRSVEYDGVEWVYTVDYDAATLTLDPAPGESGNDIDAKVTFVPKESNTTLPSWLLNKWGKSLVYGTIFALQSTGYAKQGQANPAFWYDRYQTDIARARTQTVDGRGCADVTVEMRAFV